VQEQKAKEKALDRRDEKHRKRTTGFPDSRVFRSLSLVMQFGINMLVPIAMTTILGYWLDQKLGTRFLVILFFFIGAIAGFQNIYRMAMRIGTGEDAASDEQAPDDTKGRAGDDREKK
jgi:F0F1-type ATP synthase assembly protein I